MDTQTPAPSPTPPVENVSPQNPAAEAPLSPKKPFLTGKIAILIVLLILFGTGGTYLALNSKTLPGGRQAKPAPIASKETPTSTPPPIDETENWGKLELNVFGDSKYSIKYPSSLKVLSEGPEGSGTVFSNNNKDYVIWITYINLPEGESLKSFATTVATRPVYGGGNELIKQSSKTISGQTAYVNETKMDNGSVQFQALILDPKVEGAIYNIRDLETDVVNSVEFDQILSTFKFTE